MRKALGVILACAVCCAALSGCQKKSEPVQPALDFRTLVMGAESCTYNAEIEADLGERVYRFSVDCAYAPQVGDATACITAPDTIAGICARINGETATVSFDDTSLELGTSAGGHVAPMQLPQLLGAAWTGGNIVSVAEGDDGWSATYEARSGEETLDVVTYFTAHDTPSAAEVYDGDVRVLTVRIDNFSVT